MLETEHSELQIRVSDPQHPHHHLLVTICEALQSQWSAATYLSLRGSPRAFRLACGCLQESRGLCALIEEVLHGSSMLHHVLDTALARCA